MAFTLSRTSATSNNGFQLLPKNHSLVTRHQVSGFNHLKHSSVAPWNGSVSSTLPGQFLIECIVKILWEKHFLGGDLFSVATFFYQNHKLDSRPNEATKETLQFPCMQKTKERLWWWSLKIWSCHPLHTHWHQPSKALKCMLNFKHTGRAI